MTAATRPGQVLAIVCAGIVLANLDLFIVNVALPNIAQELNDANLGNLSWILNGYAIVYAALLVFCGRLAERFPRNNSFLAGIALFTAASAACALANSVETLVAFRLVQAAGAALLTPTSLGLILATFPAERRGGAVRVWAAVGGFAAALGPLVGGLLVTASWRWIFLVNVPIGLLALTVGWIKLPRVSGHDVPTPHLWAAALITAGIATLTFGIVKVNDWGWNAPAVALSFAAAAAMLALFVAHCLRSDNPFVDPALFRIRDFTRATLTMAPFSTAFGGFLLSLVLWEERRVALARYEDRSGHRAGSLHGSRHVVVVGRTVDRPFRCRDGRGGGTRRLRRRRDRVGSAGRTAPRPVVRCPLRDPVGHRCRADAADADGGRHVGASGVIVRNRVRRDQHGSPDRFRRRRRHFRRHRRIPRFGGGTHGGVSSRLVGDGGDHCAWPAPAASAAAVEAHPCRHGTRVNWPDSTFVSRIAATTLPQGPWPLVLPVPGDRSRRESHQHNAEPDP